MSIFDFFKKKAKAPSTEIREAVLSLKRQSIVMETAEGSPAPDQSKIGGKPFLPADFVWPTFTDKAENTTRPLSFLCQIKLSDVKEFDTEGLLPNKGILSFFYECESFRWGFDPEDRGCARIFYFESTESFVSHSLPIDIAEEYTVPEIAVKFQTKASFPDYEELYLHSDIGCDWEQYDEIIEDIGGNTADCHKLLGYADVIQNEMLTDCERISRGYYCGDPEAYEKISENDEASIQESARDWTLLLQLSTIEKDGFELMWGDCGMLYFYVRKQDLKEKRFENAWFSLQCG